MLNLMKTLCTRQSLSSSKSVSIILNESKIISVEKCFYSINLNKGKNSEEISKDENIADDIASRKNVASPKVTVISTDLKLTVMTLEEAHKLSKRRDLKLVKVVDFDRKTQRPLYKLMTNVEYFQEDLHRRKEKSLRKNKETKDPKLLTLSSNIGDHDLASKIKNIIKWLNKRHEVRIVISIGGKEEAAELIAKTIETETKHCGKMVQKRKKDENLKFQLLSLKKRDDDSNDKTDDKLSEDETVAV